MRRRRRAGWLNLNGGEASIRWTYKGTTFDYTFEYQGRYYVPSRPGPDDVYQIDIQEAIVVKTEHVEGPGEALFEIGENLVECDDALWAKVEEAVGEVDREFGDE